MKPLMRRIFVVLISLLTLGMYVPPTQLDTDAAEKKELSEHNHYSQSTISPEVEEFPEVLSDEPLQTDGLIDSFTEQARAQTVAKMGPRILDKVDEDLTTSILPKMEEALDEILSSAGEGQVPYYEITEEPASGYGERIFNIYNHLTNEEVARFHVRRDKRPGEGYWFNFHYHLQDDNFMKHHQIGDVYWEKNTPPKWMS
ncbi:YpjP family protein [Halobacillus litoralis]|uniref:YpjP family protein n=1 Tax=Halobacillus litoralis TaxID=45668 RepID=UPI001CFCFE3D|nr:YpjP family protein [Halobacillus litoralis]